MSSIASTTSRRGSVAPNGWSRPGRVLLLVCLAALLSGCGLLGGGNETDSVFESSEGRFKVLMPDNREESVEKVPTPAGELDEHAVTGAVSSFEVFGVFYTDIPEQTGAINVDGAFEGAINESLSAAPGLAVTYRNKTFAYGGPAMDYTLEGADQKVWARMVIVGRRIYLIQHSGPKSEATERNYARYVDTFELLTKEQVEEEDGGLFG